MSDLTRRDKAIFNCVFNPNLPFEEAISDNVEELTDNEDQCIEIESNKLIELQAVEECEKGNIEEALKLINSAICLQPERPSLYNNRANILQFQRKFDEAFENLTKSINLCNREKHLKTLCRAHCQRGLLNRRFGNVEDARQDYEIAAKLGDLFAKSQLVELNPYAALCNQMLKQVMEKL